FYYSGSVVPNYFAHPIQIINTANELSKLPGVVVTVYFVCIQAPVSDILESLSVKRSPDLYIKGMIPLWLSGRLKNPESAYKDNRIIRTLLQISHFFIFLLSKIKGERVVVYTRNQNMLLFHRRALKWLNIPVFIEMHQFEHIKKYRNLLKRANNEKRPKLSEIKQFLRRERREEIQRLELADGILPVTKEIQRLLRQYGLTRPMEWVPSASRTLSEQDALPENSEDIDILYIGQLYQWKGVDTLIRTIGFLDHNYKVMIIGGNREKDKRRVKRLAEETGVRDRVIFQGHIPHRDVYKFIRRAKLCVIPLPRARYPESRFCTSPMKMFEILSSGTAIVASDLPSLREILRHNHNAYLVRPDDPKALAQGITTLLKDNDLRRRIAEQGKKDAANFTWSARAQKIYSFITRVCQERK
ncbi:glycosyltransferase family 4 protein, partial [Candidatus Sumerlaeota bacterium]|nr:glycosyltransferase family 4 protein [Candidatus Sumerlaeota bacterium]